MSYNTKDIKPSDFKKNPIKEERLGLAREVGKYAVWSLSSCKSGFGVERLRDNIVDSYWQSDGLLPHLVNIQFREKTKINQIYLYSDYKLDQSYTPANISIRAGSHFNDLKEVHVVELKKPKGWINIPIKVGDVNFIRTFMLQIAIMSNHQNGRDSHLRQIRIHAPNYIEDHLYPLESFGKFSSAIFRQFSIVR